MVMLSIQYRMRPDIRLFPSQAFYQGHLEDSVFIQQEVSDMALFGSMEVSAASDSDNEEERRMRIADGHSILLLRHAR